MFGWAQQYGYRYCTVSTVPSRVRHDNNINGANGVEYRYDTVARAHTVLISGLHSSSYPSSAFFKRTTTSAKWTRAILVVVVVNEQSAMRGQRVFLQPTQLLRETTFTRGKILNKRWYSRPILLQSFQIRATRNDKHFRSPLRASLLSNFSSPHGAFEIACHRRFHATNLQTSQEGGEEHSCHDTLKEDEDDTKDIPVNPELEPHIRLPNITSEEGKTGHSGFTVSFLGTGAGQVSVHRSNASTALRLGRTTFLFDAGEGVQRQLMLSRVSVGSIDKIFSKLCFCSHQVDPSSPF
jgi:hypothetical protein